MLAIVLSGTLTIAPGSPFKVDRLDGESSTVSAGVVIRKDRKSTRIAEYTFQME